MSRCRRLSRRDLRGGAAAAATTVDRAERGARTLEGSTAVQGGSCLFVSHRSVESSEIENYCSGGAICVRWAQEARLQSLAMQLAESDCTLRVTNTHLCSADSARAKEK